MGNIVALESKRVWLEESYLEDVLKEMTKYGKPRLFYMGDNNWHCALDMFVTGTGVEFKIGTSFKEPSATEATKKCISLMYSALTELNNKVQYEKRI
jgi:hypothetical protein